jgi:hypothetical protein
VSFTDKTTLIQWKLAWFIATTSRCLFEFFRGLAFVRSSLQRIFPYGRFFTVKELIQTPIEKTAQEKIRRSPTGERERSVGSWWYKTTFHRWQKLSNTL